MTPFSSLSDDVYVRIYLLSFMLILPSGFSNLSSSSTWMKSQSSLHTWSVRQQGAGTGCSRGGGFEGPRNRDCSPVLQHLSYLSPGKSGPDNWVTEQKRGCSWMSYNQVKASLKSKWSSLLEFHLWVLKTYHLVPFWFSFFVLDLSDFFLPYCSLDEFFL